jgi:UDP-N-acetylglucosamine 2-epimerase (non-hydrolysing)
VPGVALLEPLGHGAAASLMAAADLVLTDSGGVQEEAPALGRRVLVLRDVTERPEGVSAGVAELVGTEPARIVAAARAALAAGPVAPCLCYGDGRAAGRIADIVLERLGGVVTPAPRAAA